MMPSNTRWGDFYVVLVIPVCSLRPLTAGGTITLMRFFVRVWPWPFHPSHAAHTQCGVFFLTIRVLNVLSQISMTSIRSRIHCACHCSRVANKFHSGYEFFFSFIKNQSLPSHLFKIVSNLVFNRWKIEMDTRIAHISKKKIPFEFNNRKKNPL